MHVYIPRAITNPPIIIIIVVQKKKKNYSSFKNNFIYSLAIIIIFLFK